jgi:DNA replication protein DnaC
MTLDRWDDEAKVTYDRKIWRELTSLRFVEAGHSALIMGPVGVGKTFLATALGHAAVGCLMSPLNVPFVGGTTGRWSIKRLETVAGSPLPPASRLRL